MEKAEAETVKPEGQIMMMEAAAYSSNEGL